LGGQKEFRLFAAVFPALCKGLKTHKVLSKYFDWISGQINKWMDACKHGCMDGQMGRRMDR
jgi:hypothetical protein